ncbi:MAG: DUF2079 domain-containing protein [Acidimicrobiales bacterium]|jgi:hypothetical protein|nr:DUF2079 domain-containing protein [Acidimicrobiales bacterium]
MALTLVVSAFVALGRPGTAFFSDEGAAVLQAQILADTGEWQYVPPPGSAGSDPDLSPFVRGDRGPDGVAPYAKHPLYPLVLSVLGPERPSALLALSVAGTVVAAIGAALLAGRTAGAGRAAQLAVLWVVGAGSPLLFDSALVVAHTVAAGLVVVAVLAVVAARDATPRGAVGWAVLSTLFLVLAGMVRTESLLVGPALAVALVVVDRRRPGRAVVLAGCAVGSSVLAWGLDRAWSEAVAGPSAPALVTVESSGWLVDRVTGAGTTLLRSTSSSLGDVDVLLWVALALTVVAVVALRRRGRVDLLVGAAGVTALVWLVRLRMDPPALVPGLLVAFPVGVAATLLALPPPRHARVDRLVWLTVGLAAAGVLATQYGIGGGVEWGGRYFALLLPLWIAVAVPGAMGRLQSVSTPWRRLLYALAGVVSVVGALNMVSVQRHVHGTTSALLEEVREVADGLPDTARVDGRVVLVSENRLLPQIAYTDFDRYAWVVGRPDALAGGLDGVAESGVSAALALTPDPVGLEVVADRVGWTVTTRRDVGGSYQLLVLAPPS